MTKKLNIKLLQISAFNFLNYSIIKKTSKGAIIYRCKYCRKSRVKKENNTLIKLSGHDKHCKLYKNCFKKAASKCNNMDSQDSEKEKHLLIDGSFSSTNFTQNKLVDNSDKVDTYNNSNISGKKRQKKIQNDFLKRKNNFILLKNVFDKLNHLNKYEEEIGLYYLNRGKILGCGASTTTYLGEDKLSKVNIAILEIKNNYEDNINIESYILPRIQGRGNFPQLYMIYTNEEYFYFIENLMGPDLSLLFDICQKKFDILTVLNIGIDLTTNLKILHDRGFLHRDLKPDNLVFGNLCIENFKNKNNIGIIDFGNAKKIFDVNGEIKYSNKKISCMGNHSFSSNNALRDMDVYKKDDIISLFYILIYFFRGNLPWKKRKPNGEKLLKEEIIKIRKNIKLKDLCKNFPEEFISLFENILELPDRNEPDYFHIIKTFKLIKQDEENKKFTPKYKFIWIDVFDKYINSPNSLSLTQINKIQIFINKYSIKIKEYMEYINFK